MPYPFTDGLDPSKAGFVVYFQKHGYDLRSCSGAMGGTIPVGLGVRTLTLRNLQGYTNYTINITAYNSLGRGTPSVEVVRSQSSSELKMIGTQHSYENPLYQKCTQAFMFSGQ